VEETWKNLAEKYAECDRQSNPNGKPFVEQANASGFRLIFDYFVLN
jgi:hypothetical protein